MLLKHKCPSPRIGKKPRGNIGRWLYAAFLTATLSASLCQPASAATVWEKANEIMRDVYTQILGISTIAAIVTAAVALLMMNFSRSGRTVDESRAWLKRIIITWAVLNGLGFIMSYVIRSITAYNEIDLELPGKQPCAYYCITSDQDSTFDFLSSLFLSFVFIRLVRYADEHCPGGELPVPVHVLGEELCACGVIPDLSRKISVIRSRNLSMSCVFQNLAGLQNRYPYNQWQEILGNCDVQLFLGCTDALTAEFISDRTGEASISVTSKAKQLGTWRVSNYTPEYRETSGVGRRKLMTMDEVLRMDIDKALILIRGKNVLEVDKYDYSKHPEAKKLRPSKAASHVPAWRANQPQEKQTPSAPPSQAAEKKPAQKKKPASAEKVVAVTKESIMKKKEDT